jgi:ABC-type transport system substrate-binding protein
MKTSALLLAGLLGAASLPVTTAALEPAPAPAKEKVLHLPIRTDGPKSLDPVEGSTVYDNMACAQTYETLLEVSYADPRTFQPLLLAELPEQLEGGKSWRFRLKPGVRFHDDACFEGGKGREVTTDDVFYSLKRLADAEYAYKNFWLVKDAIVGFDEFKEEQAKNESCDYDAPVAGFVKIDDHTFEIHLNEPVYRFLWVLSMFQTSIVPREAVEKYGDEFPTHPVGTGPFLLEEWVPKTRLVYTRNPAYHGGTYPSEWGPSDTERGMAEAAGQPVPMVDRLEFTMFVEDQPMWLQFESGKLAYTEVPAEYFEQAFSKRSKKLKRDYKKRGITSHESPLLDFIFIGFNMEDELLGGYTPERKALRQAMSLALDWDERNDTFYNGKNIVYDGPIPPTLEGFPEDGKAKGSYRGPNLERARELLAKAGYPNGEGLPPIEYYTSTGGNNREQADLFKRQLAEVGVQLDVKQVDFSQLIENVNNRKAPMFSFAWSSDYPDAENNLALFYGPNESPGSNHYNYASAEYDALYEKIVKMAPSAERTALYEKMRDMVIEDVPYLGSMARTRHYLIAPWAKNMRPTERCWSWFKYVDVDGGAKSEL